MESITIVGASLAGLRAAQALRASDFSGRISLVGEEDSLPYDRPPLSKDALKKLFTGEASLSEVQNETALISREEFAALSLDLHLGQKAVSLNAEKHSVALQNSTEVVSDGIIVATGARPFRIPAAENMAGVHYLRSFGDCSALADDLRENPGRLAVVGAGFIGAEVAATARSAGLEVSLVEMAKAPLERVLGAEVGGVCAEIHRENGVDLRLGVAVEGFEASPDTGRVSSVVLSDGSSIEASVVVVGVGVIPNTEWLETSSLSLDNGVSCDETCLAAPGITAAGDVARWHNRRFNQEMRVEHWDNAISQGEAAARRLLADDSAAQPYDPIPWFWSDQYEHKIQLSGISVDTDETHTAVGSFDERKFVVLYGRGGKLVGALGFNRPRHTMLYSQMIEKGLSLKEAASQQV